MPDEAEFYSVKLTQDISGGYGQHKSGSTLKNLSKTQADALHQAGHSEAPKAQKGGAEGDNIASGTTAAAVGGQG